MFSSITNFFTKKKPRSTTMNSPSHDDSSVVEPAQPVAPCTLEADPIPKNPSISGYTLPHYLKALYTPYGNNSNTELLPLAEHREDQITKSNHPPCYDLNWTDFNASEMGKRTPRLLPSSKFAVLFGSLSINGQDKNIMVFDTTLYSFKKIVAGESFAIFLTETGVCYLLVSDGEAFDSWIQDLEMQDFAKKHKGTPLLVPFTVNTPIADVFAHSFAAFLTLTGEVYLMTDKFKGKIPKEKFGNQKVIHIGCGNEHAIFVTENGNVYGFGANSSGQLGCADRWYGEQRFLQLQTSHIPNRICKAFCTYNTTIVLTVDHDIYACGDPSYAANGMPYDSYSQKYDCNKLEQIPMPEKVETVIPGLFFVSVKTLSGKFYVFGYNNFGQFGVSAVLHKDKIIGPHLLDTVPQEDIADMECGGYNSIVITKRNEVLIGGWSTNSPLYPSTTFENVYNLIDFPRLLQVRNDAFNCGLHIGLHATMGRYFTIVYSTSLLTAPHSNFEKSYKLCDISIVTEHVSGDNLPYPWFMYSEDDY